MKAVSCRDFVKIFVLIISFFYVATVSAEGSGILTITTDPPNASLYIDGQFVGQTPLLKHPLPAGQHTLFLRDQTQQVDYTKIMEIVAGDETALNIPLQKDYCKLTITSKPDSSEVYLLTPLGKTPIYDEQIDQGTFTFEIRNPGSRYVTLRKNNIYIDKNTPCVINDPLPKKKFLAPKKLAQIGLCLASAGSYTWSFSRGYWGTQKSAVPGFVLGTVFLTGLGIVALF